MTLLDNALVLKDGNYYNPNTKSVNFSDNTYYDLSGDGVTTNTILHDENGKVVSYGQLVLNYLWFSNVTLVNTPYYAGSSMRQVNQSDNVYIESLLYDASVMVYRSN